MQETTTIALAGRNPLAEQAPAESPEPEPAPDEPLDEAPADALEAAPEGPVDELITRSSGHGW